MNDLKLLDCTLRDGGYYNSWDFKREFVQTYLQCMEKSNVNYVELGFRSPEAKVFRGPYYYTTDEFISSLNLPKSISYCVMINGKQFINSMGGDFQLIDSLFEDKKHSHISLVRIAIDFNYVLESIELVKSIKKMGYDVAINLMQSHSKTDSEYKEIAKNLRDWNLFNVLYFADSLGNMLPDEVKKICSILSDNWGKDLGIHTHNNKNMALINTMTAVQNNTTWCDSTITGMGRGAGNVSTESLMFELNRIGLHKGNAICLQPTVEKFTKLKKDYDWGPNIYYHYAANKKIHPTFVQTMLSDKRYGDQEVLSALEFLANRNSTSFSANAVREAVFRNDTKSVGSWDPRNWFENKEVLIVGAGRSSLEYKTEIESYIKSNSPIVLFLNINKYIDVKYGDATIVSHPTRALLESSHYKNLNHPIILPKSRLAELIDIQVKGLNIFDYGLNLKENAFKVDAQNCTLGWPLAIAYALAIVTRAKVPLINLIGFDGYGADDPRQKEMNNIFKKYSSIKDTIQIKALTPSSYQIKQGSIFSPS